MQKICLFLSSNDEKYFTAVRMQGEIILIVNVFGFIQSFLILGFIYWLLRVAYQLRRTPCLIITKSGEKIKELTILFLVENCEIFLTSNAIL